MNLPFTTQQFFDVFAAYNTAIWPSQLALLGLGLVGAASAFSRRPELRRFSIAALAAFWLWMAVVYHAVFFSAINPAATVFAVLFMTEMVALTYYGAFFQRDDPSRAEVVSASILLAYAFIGYPAVAYFAGQRFPSVPTFGAPCPTTIFTFAILCLGASSLPWFVLAIPVLWTLIATSAAVQLGVPEDFGLIAAAAITIVLTVTSHRVRRKELAWI